MIDPSRRRIAASVALCGAWLIVGCGGEAAPPANPAAELRELLGGAPCVDCNVLLLSLDTVRADFLPCYGFPQDTAPRICRFAEENLLFEQAYSPAPSTVPALTSVMAGSIVSNENLGAMLGHFERRTFLAESLADRGYRTAGVTDHGGFGTLRNMRRKSANLLRGFQEFQNLGGGRDLRRSEQVTEAGLEWLDQNQDDRFFLWLHYFDPHFNWMPPDDLAFAFGFEAETCGRIRNGIDIAEIRELERELSPREVDCLKALHQAEIRFTDGYVGRVLDHLDSLGLAGSTLVILLSDHGEEFLDRTRIGHERTVYNELVRVPLAIRNPARLQTRRVATTLGTASLHEIVLALLGAGTLDLDEAVVSRTHHYYQRFGRDPVEAARPNSFALVDGPTKAIFSPGRDTFELYDLEQDPGELTAVDDPERIARYRERMTRWIAEHDADETSSDEAREQFEETEERLKSLGYIR